MYKIRLYFSEESATSEYGLLDITGNPFLFQLKLSSFDLSSYLIQSIHVTVFLVALSSHTTHQRKIGYSAKGRVFFFLRNIRNTTIRGQWNVIYVLILTYVPTVILPTHANNTHITYGNSNIRKKHTSHSKLAMPDAKCDLAKNQ